MGNVTDKFGEGGVALAREIDEFIDREWDSCLADISTLVAIPSVEDLAAASEDAPFGPEVARALDSTLTIASRMGFDTCNVDGYAGYAELPGESDTQLGIIGHIDVVPAGDGWATNPFEMTEREGFILGRGVIDDKGPLVTALYAMKFWKDRAASLKVGAGASTAEAAQLPVSIRAIIGCNEETGMKCVAHYRKHYADPAFLFTPDAEFPVCYGEKGIYTADFSSATIVDGAIVELSGGQAYNAVPSSAHATIRLTDDMRGRALGCLEAREDVTFCISKDGALEVEAIGRSAHASTPEGGINAIGRLVNFILDFKLGTADELAFLRTLSAIMASTDGSGIGIATSDDDFGALTLVGGKISLIAEGGAKRIVQGIDIRYPTSTNAVQLDDAFEKLGGKIGAKIEHVKVITPFMVDANAPEIQVMINTFNEVTGLERKPFTMGGGTYAREFSRGASFGPEMPWEEMPEWAGAMHGPNEAVSIELLKTALKIYILTIGRLTKVLGE